MSENEKKPNKDA
jgi:26S proteasome regulatory subunit T1